MHKPDEPARPGPRATVVTTVMHPRSGETYVVEMDDDGRIQRAAGPCPVGLTEDAMRSWLDNTPSADAEEDAAWLTRQ